MKNTVPLFDWSAIDCHIADEPLTIDGLRKRRLELEKLVAPFVSRTAQSTGQVLLFKGRRHYLKPLTNLATPLVDSRNVSKELKRIGCAIRALQFIYHAEAASKAGDMDKVARMAVGFAECYYRVAAIDQWKNDVVDALTGAVKMRKGRAKGGEATTKWTPDVDRKARKIYQEVRRATKSFEAACTRTQQRLLHDHGYDLSMSTVKRRLK